MTHTVTQKAQCKQAEKFPSGIIHEGNIDIFHVYVLREQDRTFECDTRCTFAFKKKIYIYVLVWEIQRLARLCVRGCVCVYIRQSSPDRRVGFY